MSLLERLRTDTVAARKSAIGKPAGDPAKTRADLLVTLSGEIQTLEKSEGFTGRALTDNDITGVIRKFLKNAEDNLSRSPQDAKLLTEKAVLEGYLPDPLNEALLREEIARLAAASNMTFTVRDTKFVFDNMELRFPGQVTSKVISAILKESAA